ncbi:ABC transporter ATP-binding protein [Tessaracoccus sp. MC1679]|uniref:ABC transporter ATP-binding protein n=1 Tax=Tessaracoccus sp. MC1679 TaxID=2760313 RepID=UPI0016013A8A|nr:ABC transporter ATP-binding protein [Tessaracoccus sp. MC1679]MBB1516956.1 ABC transporter ATP-binding protein [Tessaracoccus sp. MC1679]NCD19801.1 ABC transporter ATP-binding protein [Actinomycetota bacterium]
MTSATPRADALSLDQVTKTYKRGGVAANQAISLTFRPGELVALIGHNGAGKTTLLNQIIGTVKPTSGDIRYGASSLVAAPDLARRVAAMMPQMYAPLTGVTPLQAITSIARLRGLPAADAKRAALDLIDSLDIGEWKDTGGEKLSGGLRRLTSYAMAVVAPPPVLLVDEPTNDVDPVRRPLIWRHLRRLADAGHTVVVVTHNLLEVQRAADRYVLLQKGAVLVDSTPRQLARQARTATLTVSVRPGTEIPSTPPATAHSVDEDGQLTLDLEPAQIPAAIEWVLQLVATGAADSYALAPASLETLYEGITNGR